MKTKKKRSSKVKLDNSTDLSKHFSPVSKADQLKGMPCDLKLR